ncbi:MAG: hypothetical protein E7536_04280 [Ruminococcaceae bacterium]|nr:hypothetical protein [Oscillospiraceae bacterium]
MMDFIIEVIIDIFAEVYLRIMTAFLPKTKLKKWQMKMILGIEAVVLIFIMIIGATMVAETKGENVAGKILVSVSVAIIVAQMTFGIMVRIKNRKNK